jgi:hypothetical protein
VRVDVQTTAPPGEAALEADMPLPELWPALASDCSTTWKASSAYKEPQNQTWGKCESYIPAVLLQLASNFLLVLLHVVMHVYQRWRDILRTRQQAT